MISIFSANMPNGLVPEDTVHKCTTPLLFGTRGNLILDIDISSYSNTLFSIFFYLFYSTGETAARYKPGEPPLNQTAGNVGNSNPSRLEFSNT